MISELSPDEFQSLLEKDLLFGVKAAVKIGIVTEGHDDLEADVKKWLDNAYCSLLLLQGYKEEIFDNYGLLRLLGCKIVYERRSALPEGMKSVSYTGVSFPIIGGPHISKRDHVFTTLEEVLSLSSEQRKIFKDENIVQIVLKDVISFTRAANLTKQEFDRLKDRTSEIVDAIREGLPQTETYETLLTKDGAEDVLRFLTTIPADYFPSKFFVKNAFRYLHSLDNEDGIMALARLPKEHLEALETRPGKRGPYVIMDSIASLAKPYDDNPPKLSISALVNYTPEQVILLGLSAQAVLKGFITLDEASGLTQEQAKIANTLSHCVSHRATLTEATSGQIQKNDIYTLSLDEADALVNFRSILEEKLASAEQIKRLTASFDPSVMQYVKEAAYSVMLPVFRTLGNQTAELLIKLDEDQQHELFQLILGPGYEGGRPTPERIESTIGFLRGDRTATKQDPNASPAPV